ncbi:trypsin-like peptidase domain-containing protein [Mycobacterium numidiamassiliense]|nr:trypsin-like peptidase domain-containing protein [Mycobacterium numidiamassiliense]
MSAQFQIHAESFRSVLIEMVYCENGADIDTTAGQDYKSMAHGSAFVYRLDGKDRLITARHNVTGRHWQTHEFMGGYHIEPTHLRVMFFKDPPEKWVVTLSEDDPRRGGIQVLLQQYLVPLIGPDWKPIWNQHPQLGGEMDVAEVPFNPPADVVCMSWERTGDRSGPEQASWPAQLFPGEDVFIIGYPYRLTSGPAFPLWIRGTVASNPIFPYYSDGKAYPLWLIDARTRKGQSGAPVMRHRPPGTLVFRNDGQPARMPVPDSDLLGVYSGRTSDESDLGFVWGMDHVDEICRNGVPGTIDPDPSARSCAVGEELTTSNLEPQERSVRP